MAFPDSTAIDYLGWNAREYLVFNDLADGQRLARRRLVSEILGALGAEPWAPTPTLSLRVIGNALLPVGVGGDTITLAAGSMMFAPAADPGDPAEYALFHTVAAALVSDPVTTPVAGGDRVDIVTIKIDGDVVATSPTDEESRLVKDAITGALSSQNLSKRRRTQLTANLVEGTPGAGAPATPAGEVRIASAIMLDTTSVYDSVTDERDRSIWPRVQEVAASQKPRITLASFETFTPQLFFGGAEVGTYNSRSGRINRFFVSDNTRVALVHIQVDWAAGVANAGAEIRNVPIGAIGAVAPNSYNGGAMSNTTLARGYLSNNVTPGVLDILDFAGGGAVTGTATGVVTGSLLVEIP